MDWDNEDIPDWAVGLIWALIVIFTGAICVVVIRLLMVGVNALERLVS